MTTITINEELGIGRNSFESLSELLAYLEENGLMVVLHELPEDEITSDIRSKADAAKKKYAEDPGAFLHL